MRSNVHAPFKRALSQASIMVVFGGLLSACSNDMSRFEESLITNTSMTSNQHAIMKKSATATQAYPGDVVAVAKPKRSSYEYSGIRVSKPPKVSAPRSLAPSTAAPVSASTRSSSFSTPKVTAPKVVAPSYTTPKPASNQLVLAPRPTSKQPLKIVGTDPVSTGSITKVQKPETPRGGKTGWTGGGGTWVNVKSGETLYNLSRRYGVPVSAIMQANSMSDANSLKLGQRVLIPAYTYNKDATVSAPDNNPMTKASRASNGFQGQVRGQSVPTPKARQTPVRTATAAHSTATTGGTYTVQSGDTLYGIASKLGTTALNLRTANGISGSTIRLGQTLHVPAGSVVAPTQTIDNRTTGSVPKPSVEKPKTAYKAPVGQSNISTRSAELVKTPAQTGSGAFRWPIRGRVITKFGERINGSSNDGIDISVPEGTPVKATENGTVIYSGSELADFGNLILVSHTGGWVSAYAHANLNKVKRGDKVKRGQVIAMSGKTGNATVPKLHFELRKNSTPVNPLKHLK